MDGAELDIPARIFSKCVRCGYSLTGLPAEHACPECGLAYDAKCEIYRLRSAKLFVLLPLITFFIWGWMSVDRLLASIEFFDLSTMSTKQVALLLFDLALFPAFAFYLRFMVRRYREGYAAAITADGLMLNLPDQDGVFLAWEDLGGAEIKDIFIRNRFVATVRMRGKRGRIDLGVDYALFPTREKVTSFVDQVNLRIEGVHHQTSRESSKDLEQGQTTSPEAG